MIVTTFQCNTYFLRMYLAMLCKCLQILQLSKYFMTIYHKKSKLVHDISTNNMLLFQVLSLLANQYSLIVLKCKI